jgi:hypothetical protein
MKTRVLLRAKMPSERQGCVKKPEHTYLRSIRKSPLTPINRYLPARSTINSPVGRVPTAANVGWHSNIIGPSNLCNYMLSSICV